MIVGKYLGRIKHRNKIVSLIGKVLGHLDLHTQLRVVPLLKYLVKCKKDLKYKNIVEIGCGVGNNCFEIFFKYPENKILGFDLNIEAIETANKISSELGVKDKINFMCTDATKYDYASIGNVELLLLIDFLEHINEPEKFLESIKDVLSEECEILVSVPTYTYKKIFGDRFHQEVGHVKDGYTLEELNTLFYKIGFVPKFVKYNTGFPANLGCYLFYRVKYKNKYLNFIKQLILYPFSYFDIINNQIVSCSLFVVYTKEKK